MDTTSTVGSVKDAFKALTKTVQPSEYSLSDLSVKNGGASDSTKRKRRSTASSSAGVSRRNKHPRLEAPETPEPDKKMAAESKKAVIQMSLSRTLPGGGSKHRRRTKRCGGCRGCKAPECGSCQSCRINTQFKDQLKIGLAECLVKACLHPIQLDYNTVKDQMTGKTVMTTLMEQQEDGACAVKIINGRVVDFRCFICQKLPRAGMANRSELYRHYSLYHYTQQLLAEFGSLESCPVPGCTKTGKGKTMADHMGQVHNEVEKYIPVENRIPLKAPRKKKAGGKSRGKPEKAWEFPDVPERYVPQDRTVTRDSGPSVFAGGFELVLVPTIHSDPEVSVPEEKCVAGYPGWVGECGYCSGGWVDLPLLLRHLAGEHHLALDCIKTDDVVEFLRRERIIRLSENRLTPSESGCPADNAVLSTEQLTPAVQLLTPTLEDGSVFEDQSSPTLEAESLSLDQSVQCSDEERAKGSKWSETDRNENTDRFTATLDGICNENPDMDNKILGKYPTSVKGETDREKENIQPHPTII